MDRRKFIGLSVSLLAGITLPPLPENASAAIVEVPQVWRRIALTSRRMRELHIAGGDGFQYVIALAYAPSDPRVVYLAVDMSGVWRSTDGGRSWEPRLKGFTSYGARSIAVDPLNRQIVLAAGFLGFNAEQAQLYPNRYQGIYLTVDGGANWRMVHRTDFFKNVANGTLFLIQRPLDKNTQQSRCLHAWCASGSEGLLESVDGGETWQKTSVNNLQIHDMAFLPGGSKDFLFAAADGLFVYRSGVAEKIGAGLTTFPRTIALSSTTPGKVYASLGRDGVAVSYDDGRTFKSLKRFYFPNLDITNIAVSPVAGDKLYIRANISTQAPYTSENGGQTWDKPDDIDPEGLIGKPGFYYTSPFAPHPTDSQTCLHVTNGRARIIRTDDGGKTWHFSGSGFTGARMSDILFFSASHMIFCLTDHGLWETKDNCQTFTELKTKRIDGAKSASVGSVSGSNIVVGFGSWGEKGLVVSHNGGVSFKNFDHIKDRFNFVAFHPSIAGLVYAGPYMSTDYGRSWHRLPETVRSISSDGSLLYAINSKGSKNSTIMISRDSGAHFRPEIELGIPIGAIKQLQVTPDNNLILLATTRGVYRIEKQHVELRDHRHGLAKDAFGTMYTECVNFDPNNPARVFAGRRALGFGNGNGIFVSSDSGRNWQNANLNLFQGVTVFAVKINPFDSSVYIGTSFGTFILNQFPSKEMQA